jgi:hypothetical protein
LECDAGRPTISLLKTSFISINLAYSMLNDFVSDIDGILAIRATLKGGIGE